MRQRTSASRNASSNGLLQTVKRQFHGLFKESQIPRVMSEKFITSGYRLNYSLRQCVVSMFQWHNETLNIWTHLFGLLFCFGLTLHLIFFSAIPTTMLERVCMIVYLLCVLNCLFSSTVFHTFSCKSLDWFHALLNYDYVGISLLIVGSYIPPLYFGFNSTENPSKNWAKTSVVTVVAFSAVCTAIIMGWCRKRERKYRILRVVLFVSMVVFGLLAIVHMVIVVGMSSPLMRMILKQGIVVALLYGCGVAVYAARLPERFFRGKCDILGHSHQFWHIFVLGAQIFHYFACRRFIFQANTFQ